MNFQRLFACPPFGRNKKLTRKHHNRFTQTEITMSSSDRDLWIMSQYTSEGTSKQEVKGQGEGQTMCTDEGEYNMNRLRIRGA
jgi:hypothetical protein